MKHIISKDTLPEAALAYAQAGLAVIPLRPNRKEPCGSLVRHGIKEATADPERIEQWWRCAPSANIGIGTGSGLVVIDVDPRNGGELDPTLPETLTARTASGGWHLYYSVDGKVRTTHSGMAPGVDVKSDGGYVVAPPSVRGTGSWEWANALPVARLNASVLHGQAGQTKEGRGRSARTPGEYRRFVPLEVIPEGQRHSELTRWAGWLRGQGYDAIEIDKVLSAINRQGCSTPLAEDELDEICSWAGGLPS